MKQKLIPFLESNLVQNTILVLIIVNSVILGIMTSDAAVASFGTILDIINTICLVVFTVEVVLKLIAYGLPFFKDGWNVFDFIIVAISLVPTGGIFSSFRMLRTFRVFRSFRSLRMVTKLGRLRLIVQAIIESLPSIAWTSLLLGIVFYIYAITGTQLFAADFPEWFGSLGSSFYTLFQVMTLESWSMGISRPVMELYPWAAFYFITFILFTAFVVLNVVIGVVVNTISELAQDDKIQKIKNNCDADVNVMYDEYRKLQVQMEVFQHAFEKTSLSKDKISK